MLFMGGLLGLALLGTLALALPFSTGADADPGAAGEGDPGDDAGRGGEVAAPTGEGEDAAGGGSLFDRLGLRDALDESDAEDGGDSDTDIDTGSGTVPTEGSDRADRLFGSALADLIRAGGGDDMVFGLGGADTLEGGAGDDDLFGGEAGDSLLGQAGDDALLGREGGDILDGGAGSDTLSGGTGDDLLRGGQDAAPDLLNGGVGADTLLGAGGDQLWGGAGEDALILAGGAGGPAHLGDYRAAEDQIVVICEEGAEIALRDCPTDADLREVLVDGEVVATLSGAGTPEAGDLLRLTPEAAAALGLG